MHLFNPSKRQISIVGILAAVMLIIGIPVHVLDYMHLLGYIQEKFPPLYSLLMLPGFQLSMWLVGLALATYVLVELRQTRKRPEKAHELPDSDAQGSRNVSTSSASTGPVNVTFNSQFSQHFYQPNTQTGEQSVSVPPDAPLASHLICTPGDCHGLIGKDHLFWTDEWGQVLAAVATIRNELGSLETPTEANMRAEIIFENLDRTQEQRVNGCWLKEYTQFATFGPGDEHKLLLVTQGDTATTATIWNNQRKRSLFGRNRFRTTGTIPPLKPQSLQFNPAFITVRLFRENGEIRGTFYLRYETRDGGNFTVTPVNTL